MHSALHSTLLSRYRTVHTEAGHCTALIHQLASQYLSIANLAAQGGDGARGHATPGSSAGRSGEHGGGSSRHSAAGGASGHAAAGGGEATCPSAAGGRRRATPPTPSPSCPRAPPPPSPNIALFPSRAYPYANLAHVSRMPYVPHAPATQPLPSPAPPCSNLGAKPIGDTHPSAAHA